MTSAWHDMNTHIHLLEAAEALQIADDATTHRTARRLVNHALAWGWSPRTGLHGQRTPVYRDALEKAWRFTRETLVDPVHGGPSSRPTGFGGRRRAHGEPPAAKKRLTRRPRRG